MVPLHQRPTDGLSSAIRAELRTFLEQAYSGEVDERAFSEDDWNHALGGVHLWLSDAGRIICHASVIERTLVCDGQQVQAGYVEAVATIASRRRQGHGSVVMKRAGELICDRYVLGALSTGAHAFYERLGWVRWRGPTFVNGPRGRERTPDDDGGIMILRTRRSPQLDLNGDIVCDWRDGDVW